MKQLSFAEPEAVILLDATFPDDHFFRAYADIPLIAADGAGTRLLAGLRTPDWIVGDLDTFVLPPGAQYPPERLVHMRDQDSNDFEKCLLFAKQQNFYSIVISGIHGGELEHTLNNWSVLSRYGRTLNLCLYDAGRYGFPLAAGCCLATVPGEIISLLPQPAVLLTTRGLRWELRGESLALGRREGARNVALGRQIDIDIHSGELLLFCNARLPGIPVLHSRS